MAASESDELLDAAAHLVVEDGFDALSVARIANEARMTEAEVFACFGSLEDLLVAMLNREFAAVWTAVLNDVERDPRGGLLSRIYRYTLPAAYERPLIRTLYLSDRDGLHTIVRAAHGVSDRPQFGLREDFVHRMQEIGMVRPHINAAALTALLEVVSAGVAITAPHAQLDDINEGLFELLASAVDADVDDTLPGKLAFVEYALSLSTPAQGR